jgi:beta-glucosidase-like glycosyl hydrolase
MAEAISTEGRIKYEQAVREKRAKQLFFQGLDFWAPNINIFRDPRWGRGQETYGEDPVPHRPHGRSLRHRHAGRRSTLLPRHLHSQALRRS